MEGGMKKFWVFLWASVLVLGALGVAAATPVPWTWTDVYTDPAGDVYFSEAGNGGLQTYSYIHDIRDEGFDPLLEDIVTSAILNIDFYDDRVERPWVSEAVMVFPQLSTGTEYDFSYDDPDFGISILALVFLNLTGQLQVTLEQVEGDFYFAQSTLEASGRESSPVPEPATVLLIGTGLAGVAGLRRRVRKK
jgi:hypothetical protein